MFEEDVWRVHMCGEVVKYSERASVESFNLQFVYENELMLSFKLGSRRETAKTQFKDSRQSFNTADFG
jgi:hypothetical protein